METKRGKKGLKRNKERRLGKNTGSLKENVRKASWRWGRHAPSHNSRDINFSTLSLLAPPSLFPSSHLLRRCTWPLHFLSPHFLPFTLSFPHHHFSFSLFAPRRAPPSSLSFLSIWIVLFLLCVFLNLSLLSAIPLNLNFPSSLLWNALHFHTPIPPLHSLLWRGGGCLIVSWPGMSGVWPKRVRTRGKEMWSGWTERPYGGSLSEQLHALRHGDTTRPRVKEGIDPPSTAWWASQRFPWRIDIIPKADHMNEGMMCVGAWVCESRRVSKEDLMEHQRCDAQHYRNTRL